MDANCRLSVTSIMKTLLFVLVATAAVYFSHGMTEKQMKSATKLVRNACQPKTKVTDEQIEDMHKGVWDEDQAIKCYMNCVLVMFKVAKKTGEFDFEAAMKQVPTMPEARQEMAKSAMIACSEKLTAGDEKCDNSWKIAKCIYEENPENYFLP